MLKDEIKEILEKLYLDNRGNTARGDYKEYIDQALFAILSKIRERVPKEIDTENSYINPNFREGHNQARTNILKEMEG